MKRMIALLLLMCMCCSLSACDRKLMWRHQMTDPPTAPSTLPHPTVNNTVEEISPGVAEINGCRVELNQNFTRVLNYDGKLNCMAMFTFVNNRSETVSMDSVCRILVFQNGKLCQEIAEEDDIYGTLTDDGEQKVEPGKMRIVNKIFALRNGYEPIEIQIRHNGDVITKITYDPLA